MDYASGALLMSINGIYSSQKAFPYLYGRLCCLIDEEALHTIIEGPNNAAYLLSNMPDKNQCYAFKTGFSNLVFIGWSKTILEIDATYHWFQYGNASYVCVLLTIKEIVSLQPEYDINSASHIKFSICCGLIMKKKTIVLLSARPITVIEMNQVHEAVGLYDVDGV